MSTQRVVRKITTRCGNFLQRVVGITTINQSIINHILFANMKNSIQQYNNIVNVSTHVAGYQKSCRSHQAGQLL